MVDALDFAFIPSTKYGENSRDNKRKSVYVTIVSFFFLERSDTCISICLIFWISSYLDRLERTVIKRNLCFVSIRKMKLLAHDWHLDAIKIFRENHIISAAKSSTGLFSANELLKKPFKTEPFFQYSNSNAIRMPMISSLSRLSATNTFPQTILSSFLSHKPDRSTSPR